MEFASLASCPCWDLPGWVRTLPLSWSKMIRGPEKGISSLDNASLFTPAEFKMHSPWRPPPPPPFHILSLGSFLSFQCFPPWSAWVLFWGMWVGKGRRNLQASLVISICTSGIRSKMNAEKLTWHGSCDSEWDTVDYGKGRLGRKVAGEIQ